MASWTGWPQFFKPISPGISPLNMRRYLKAVKTLFFVSVFGILNSLFLLLYMRRVIIHSLSLVSADSALFGDGWVGGCSRNLARFLLHGPCVCILLPSSLFKEPLCRWRVGAMSLFKYKFMEKNKNLSYIVVFFCYVLESYFKTKIFAHNQILLANCKWFWVVGWVFGVKLKV